MRVPLVLLFFALCGCVPPKVKEAQVATDASVTLLAQRQAVVEQSALEAEKKLEQVQATLRLLGKDKGDLMQALDEASDQVRAVRGEMENLRFELEDLRKAMDAYTVQQETRQLHDELRLKAVERALGLPTPPAPGLAAAATTGAGTEKSPEPTEELPKTAGGLLERAVGEMQAGRQGAARFLLDKAAADHPQDPLVPEIRYRIGETYANEKKWGQSAQAFERVVSSHPKSTWAPWAMLRQGEAFEQLGQKDGAVVFFEDLVRLHPRSEAAEEARKKLKTLR
jgi:TolA-binding protein